ncbi:MAG: S-methyl-5'-thioadenosine phosphorylase [Spirochaetaceae bacterium]|nr:MAG: S-methyl-5'-thioadenosine phosphorylase [Spirochaetaceae bacterium]
MKTPMAVIGGSGLYKLEGAELIATIDVPTPFGLPSDLISIMRVGEQTVAFLPRHGKGHRILPTEVPSKANIWALKSLGVEQILSISAVGSLREEIKPGDFVLCDQLIDRTRNRDLSYFGDGLVGHVPFAEPFCSGMREIIAAILKNGSHPFHDRGTLVTMEGPLFSTRAESFLYRSWEADLIGMTALPEAKLAREAEICLAVVAMVTDYDCWRETEESVSVEMILKVMNENTKAVQKVIPSIASALSSRESCSCHSAAAGVFVTDPALVPYETQRRLWTLYGKYWKDLQK